MRIAEGLAALPTPCLLLDADRVAANHARMIAAIRRAGVTLRPHMKTAKSAEVARMLAGDDVQGITVSTLAEAEHFAVHGFRDILYAVAVVPAKVPRLAALARRGVTMSVVLDDPRVAHAVGEAAAAEGAVLDALVEIDCDGHRGGLRPDDPAVPEAGKAIAGSPGLRLAGVSMHAGESYGLLDSGDQARAAGAEQAAARAAAAALDAAGLPCPRVSVGSTPTALHAGAALAGITELRAGVYMFGDLAQAGIGTNTVGDIAVSVLASVIQHAPHRSLLVLDAGALALSKDRSTAWQPTDCGYGIIADAETCHPIPGLVVTAVNQEHGLVEVRDAAMFERLPIGSRVRVLPNHACLTAAAHASYVVLRSNAILPERWARCSGW